MKGGNTLVDLVGKLAVLKGDLKEDVFVIYKCSLELEEFYIVELDRPNGMANRWINVQGLQILTPSEVLERVTEWK